MANINRKFIQSTLESLAIIRPVFHSEDDFQHELAWRIRDALKGKVKIRLERPFDLPTSKPSAETDSIHVDILIRLDRSENWVALELKHKTQKCDHPIRAGDEQFDLKAQGAHNNSRYDFWLDVRRLDRLIEAGIVTHGYAIMLTNDTQYWTPRDTKAQDKNFRLHEGRKVKGKLSWFGISSKHLNQNKEKKRRHPIDLGKREYTLNWETYSEVNEQKFRYLLLEVR